MSEVIRFPVLTPGDLHGHNAGIAALYRKLPDNPTVELLDLAINALLDYHSFLVLTSKEFSDEFPGLVEQAEQRLKVLHGLMSAWQRRQRVRLGVS
jgi:hypothetical protein